jgi:hypothetical protein
MASKPINTGLPQGFQSPFKRVQMAATMDDSMACISTLTGRNLEEVMKMAAEMGLPQHGPYYVSEDMIAKLLMKAGGLVGSKYKEFDEFDLLPDVAILLVDYDEETEIGRHVVWHHVRGTPEQPSFHYAIDVGQWVDPADQVTTAVKAFKPAYYIEVMAKANGRGK